MTRFETSNIKEVMRERKNQTPKLNLKGERTSKKNLVLNESKYDEGNLCEILVLLDASITSNK